jgi:mannose/fructose/N-acetylgalactosamine-specific phosphotransferase system component IIB
METIILSVMRSIHQKIELVKSFFRLPDTLYAEQFRKNMISNMNKKVSVTYSCYLRTFRDSLHAYTWKLVGYAEIEIGVMARQCLDRRISDQESLKREIRAWQEMRNQKGVCVNWRFTTQDARVKLKSLYPAI